METTNESQTKGKYFMITKKSDYKHAVKEVKAILKYVYPDREEDERQDYQSENTPIIHSNLSTYAQALIFFHEENPVPTRLSKKRLKIQFREQTPTMKRDAPKEVTFIGTDDPTPAPAEEQLRLQLTPYVHQTSNHSERGGNAGRGAMGGRGG